MRKLISFGLGIALGAAIGTTLMILYAPVSGEQLKRNLREGWEEALDDARSAATQRRIELEAELARKRGLGPMMLP